MLQTLPNAINQALNSIESWEKIFADEAKVPVKEAIRYLTATIAACEDINGLYITSLMAIVNAIASAKKAIYVLGCDEDSLWVEDYFSPGGAFETTLLNDENYAKLDWIFNQELYDTLDFGDCNFDDDGDLVDEVKYSQREKYPRLLKTYLQVVVNAADMVYKYYLLEKIDTTLDALQLS